MNAAIVGLTRIALSVAGNRLKSEPAMLPENKAIPQPVFVEARCVRLNAKAETPAAVSPAVERLSLSRTKDQVLTEFMDALGFRKRGSRIVAAFERAFSASRR